MSFVNLRTSASIDKKWMKIGHENTYHLCKHHKFELGRLDKWKNRLV